MAIILSCGFPNLSVEITGTGAFVGRGVKGASGVFSTYGVAVGVGAGVRVGVGVGVGVGSGVGVSVGSGVGVGVGVGVGDGVSVFLTVSEGSITSGVLSPAVAVAVTYGSFCPDKAFARERDIPTDISTKAIIVIIILSVDFTKPLSCVKYSNGKYTTF